MLQKDYFIWSVWALLFFIAIFLIAVVPEKAYYIGDSGNYLLQAYSYYHGEKLTVNEFETQDKFPLYPYFFGLFAFLLNNFDLMIPIALGINLVASMLTAFVFYKLSGSKKLTLLLLFFPQYLLFSHGVYTEALSILLVVSALYYFNKNKLSHSVFFAALGIPLRGTNILFTGSLMLANLVNVWKKNKKITLKDIKNLVFPVSIAVFFTLMLMAYYYVNFGSLFYQFTNYTATPGLPDYNLKELSIILLTLFIWVSTIFISWKSFREKQVHYFIFSSFLLIFHLYVGLIERTNFLPGNFDRYLLPVLPITLLVFKKHIEKKFVFESLLLASVIGSIVIIYGWWF